MDTKPDVTGSRSILSSLDEYRATVAELATRAQRSLSIYTPDLEPLLYDQDCFLEPLKRLVLARSHARLRVLIAAAVGATKLLETGELEARRSTLEAAHTDR